MRYLDGSWGGVELSGAVVRDPDSVNSVLYRCERIFDGHDTLHDDLHRCVLSVIRARLAEKEVGTVKVERSSVGRDDGFKSK